MADIKDEVAYLKEQEASAAKVSCFAACPFIFGIS